LAPTIAILIFSFTWKPILDLARHGLLFFPWLLFPAAFVVARGSGRRGGRVGVLALLGGLALLAERDLARPRDPNPWQMVELMLVKSPPNVPILSYPMLGEEGLLYYYPLPLMPIHDVRRDVPEHLSRCVLFVMNSAESDREDNLSLGREVRAMAKTSRTLLSSRQGDISYLEGLPDGAIRNLMLTPPGRLETILALQLGAWPRTRGWRAADLSASANPPPEVREVRSSLEGARLRASGTTLRLALPARPADEIGGLAVSCHLDAPEVGPVKCRLNGGLPWTLNPKSGDFLIAGLLPAGAREAVLDMEVPAELTRPVDIHEMFLSDLGIKPKGCYLLHAELIAIRKGALAVTDRQARQYDVGPHGDELFLRSTLHEREGPPRGEVRWTQGDFDMELMFWPGEPNREIVLAGALPKYLKRRLVRVTVAEGGGPGRDLSAETEIASTTYGQTRFVLPRSVTPGAHMVRIEIGGSWVPKECGLGGDPRHLGFFLDWVSMR
jgi:hypothetical protein